MAMKAISLWQPWATAIALGSKTIETRSWTTSYRGPIAIHAAKKKDKRTLLYQQCCWNWRGALRSVFEQNEQLGLEEALPFGAIVAIAALMDCRPTESFTLAEIETTRMPQGTPWPAYAWTERDMGDFTPGRYGWCLSDIEAIEPIPWRGAQGLFEVPNELFGAVVTP